MNEFTSEWMNELINEWTCVFSNWIDFIAVNLFIKFILTFLYFVILTKKDLPLRFPISFGLTTGQERDSI